MGPETLIDLMDQGITVGILVVAVVILNKRNDRLTEAKDEVYKRDLERQDRLIVKLEKEIHECEEDRKKIWRELVEIKKGLRDKC